MMTSQNLYASRSSMQRSCNSRTGMLAIVSVAFGWSSLKVLRILADSLMAALLTSFEKWSRSPFNMPQNTYLSTQASPGPTLGCSHQPCQMLESTISTLMHTLHDDQVQTQRRKQGNYRNRQLPPRLHPFLSMQASGHLEQRRRQPPSTIPLSSLRKSRNHNCYEGQMLTSL